MKLRFGSFASGAALLAACSLSAQTTLVSWGPSSTLMDIGTGASQRGEATSGGYDFDLNTPISPLAVTPNVNGDRTYSGSPYYGGVTSANSPSQNVGVAVRNSALAGNIDAQVFGRGTGGTVGYGTSAVFLWKQEDFLSGSDGAIDNVTITSLSYDALLLSGNVGTDLEARFVIQQGDSYIISANLGLAYYSEVHSLTDLSSVSWFAYTPELRSIGSVAIGAEVDSPSFSGVTAVGLYLSGTQLTESAAFTLGFTQFTASGTISAIPEPSSIALMAGSGVIALAALRRRKR